MTSCPTDLLSRTGSNCPVVLRSPLDASSPAHPLYRCSDRPCRCSAAALSALAHNRESSNDGGQWKSEVPRRALWESRIPDLMPGKTRRVLPPEDTPLPSCLLGFLAHMTGYAVTAAASRLVTADLTMHNACNARRSVRPFVAGAESGESVTDTYRVRMRGGPDGRNMSCAAGQL